MAQEIEKIEQTALVWPEKAKALVITDQAGYNEACGWLKEIKIHENQIKAHHGPMIETALASHRAALAAQKKFLEPLEEAKKVITKAVGAYDFEQRQKALEIQRKAQEEADRRDAQAKLDAVQTAIKEQKPTEEVSKILDAPAPIVRVEPTIQKVSGIGSREAWSAQVTDMTELCKAVAEGKVGADAVCPNMPFLNGLARLHKDKLNIPGVKAVMETVVTTRVK